MNNVINVAYSQANGWYIVTDANGRFQKFSSKPWDGSNRPGKAPIGERRFLTDRERVARDQPTKKSLKAKVKT